MSYNVPLIVTQAELDEYYDNWITNGAINDVSAQETGVFPFVSHRRPVLTIRYLLPRFPRFEARNRDAEERTISKHRCSVRRSVTLRRIWSHVRVAVTLRSSRKNPLFACNESFPQDLAKIISELGHEQGYRVAGACWCDAQRQMNSVATGRCNDLSLVRYEITKWRSVPLLVTEKKAKEADKQSRPDKITRRIGRTW